MALELLGHRTAVENQVYTINRMTALPNGHSIELTSILMPRRYTAASEEEVINLLAQKADELEGAAGLIIPGSPAQVLEGKTPLDALIMRLPLEQRMHLRTKNPELMRFIRQNTPALPIQSVEELPSYVSVSYGILSTGFIAQNNAEINVAGWYSAILQHPDIRKVGHGEQWRMRLLLQEGTLPPKQEVDFLIKYGSSVADSFEVSRPRYDKERMQEVVDALYGGLAIPGALADLPDVSTEVVTEAAIPPLIALHEYVKQQRRSGLGNELDGHQGGSGNGGPSHRR